MALRQMQLFDQSVSTLVEVDMDHELVQMEKLIDWDRLTWMAMDLRKKRVKAIAGKEPHYRELLGAVVLMAQRRVPYRVAADLIAYYAPARYLCNLMDSKWKKDPVTICEFTQMLGEEGMREINKYILEKAVAARYADPSFLLSDTTAQEAKIPYPTEVGLMGKYIKKVSGLVRKARGKFADVQKRVNKELSKVKGLIKRAHIFSKTKESKRKVAKKLFHIVKGVHKKLRKSVLSGKKLTGKASLELKRLTEVMEKLLPQMEHFIETGFVAAKKIIHLDMEKLYSIVRGKAGKSVEFGIKWGINRMKGGFIYGFLLGDGDHRSDKSFCMEAIRIHKKQFGKAPETYGYDRGGYSGLNIKRTKMAGVKNVGIAPTGKKAWEISDNLKKKVISERSQVEGAIGAIKNPIYGFNKPEARSKKAMIVYGHRGILGFNLRKLVKCELNLVGQQA